MVATHDELESLRLQIRAITSDIMQKVHQRMELARQVGEVKGRLGIDVRDEKVENEIRMMVTRQAQETGMSGEFALRLLNILLKESESVQGLSRPPCAAEDDAPWHIPKGQADGGIRDKDYPP